MLKKAAKTLQTPSPIDEAMGEVNQTTGADSVPNPENERPEAKKTVKVDNEAINSMNQPSATDETTSMNQSTKKKHHNHKHHKKAAAEEFVPPTENPSTDSQPPTSLVTLAIPKQSNKEKVEFIKNELQKAVSLVMNKAGLKKQSD